MRSCIKRICPSEVYHSPSERYYSWQLNILVMLKKKKSFFFLSVLRPHLLRQVLPNMSLEQRWRRILTLSQMLDHATDWLDRVTVGHPGLLRPDLRPACDALLTTSNLRAAFSTHEQSKEFFDSFPFANRMESRRRTICERSGSSK